MKKNKKKKGMVYIPYDYEAAFNNQIETLNEFFIEQMVKNRYKAVYALKEVIAGEQLEIEIYPEFKTMDDVPVEGKRRDNSRAQNNLNDKNARKYLTRIVNHNFRDKDIWITLTYRKDSEPSSMEEAIKNMQNYIKRLKYRRKKKALPPMKYIYITEYSLEDEIRWHHHIIMDGDLDLDTVENTWTLGDRNETRRTHKDNYGLTGMTYYITKEPNRKKGEKRWNSSKNLKQFRVHTVHSKQPEPRKGTYKPIGKYIDGFVKDRAVLEEQVKKWYPDYFFTESQIYYNDFNGMFYITARMRYKEPEEEPILRRRNKNNYKTGGKNYV